MSETLPDRLLEILDERVFGFAQAAQRHFGSNDLIVVLDLRDETPSLEAVPRQSLADANELPLDMRLKFSRPASALSETLGAPDQSFWFLVIFEDEDSEYCAVNASMLKEGS
ncbi:hypothetical protein G8A07_14880 [Roseateles sp. DAIF2]|uniref:hypothetical protein n=1 Tax=Roseateles sp. DAIF2 TaxID=2714952 RepID=UPI0018A33B69|nr:hypothetical protein [Roseateles sp. DAIF2]QPF74073.1 hypothetical protein G8A07_14880 [Roseateles sp. DAIF2]